MKNKKSSTWHPFQERVTRLKVMNCRNNLMIYCAALLLSFLIFLHLLNV